MAATTPDTASSDYEAMLPYWQMVEAIMAGAQAMRDAGETYLPKFPNETATDYDYRRANAKFTNIYRDIVENLASKPFSEEATLKDGAGERFKALSEDIDGSGNNLNVFASQTFFGGINRAVDWILVDYTRARPRGDGRPLSIAEERAQGLRPYWVRVPATRMLAVYTANVRGREVFVHTRIREDITERDGYGEVSRQRIRVLNREPIYDADGDVIDYAPATFEVWEKKATNGRRSSWVVVDGGPITIGVIPLVPFVTGRRIDGAWRFIPPLQDAAYLQVEHYQQETALKSAKETVAFPMLAGNGVQPIIVNGEPAQVPVGPKAVLYAPPSGDGGQHGEWVYVKTDAEGLKFLAEEVASTEKQLRELGRQPLTATAGITVVTAALASQKASSAVEAWALGLKDALEQAFAYTAMWLGEVKAPEVKVHTDFAIETQDGESQKTLIEVRKNGDLSRRTTWAEMQRRGILSGDFDADAEEKLLEDELPDPESEADLDAAQTPAAESEDDPPEDMDEAA